MPGGRVFTLAGMGMLDYGDNLDILRRSSCETLTSANTVYETLPS